MIEEKKNKTLWRLEKIELKGSLGRKQRGIGGSPNSDDMGRAMSRKSD